MNATRVCYTCMLHYHPHLEDPSEQNPKQHLTKILLGVRIIILPFNYKDQRSVSTAYDNSFGVKSARLWNLLPKKVNSVTELEAFKVSLGDFLVQFPDKPPVPGYTPPNSNSLLDWNCERGKGVREQH